MLAAVPSAASAAARYASPTGSGDCSSEAHACDLRTAVSNASTGDNVYVRGDQGEYDLGAFALSPGEPGVHVHGTHVGTHGRPQLIFSGPYGLTTGGGTADQLYIEVDGAASNAFALTVNAGSADAVIAKAAAGGSACFIHGGTLTNSVCWLTGSGGPAALGSRGTNVLRGVTAYATGSGVQDGVHVEGDSGEPGHDLLVNVIAHGSAIGYDLSGQTNGTGSAVIETSHTNYSSTSFFGAGASAMDDDPHQTLLPKLVDPGIGDFHQQATSPTIDHGVNSLGNGPTDWEGDLRTFNSVPDIGADERVGPPTATTGGATGVTASKVTLHGTVNPNGGFTTYFFDYGKTLAYGQYKMQTLTAGMTARQVLAALVGLSPRTKYFFRLVAVNSVGTATGTAGSFTTAAAFGVAIVSKQATVKKGKVGIALRCPVQASGSCKGTLSLKTAKKVKLGPAKKGFLALGNATFSIPAGLTVKVPVKISQAGLKRLKKRKSLAASATVAAHDGPGQLKTTSGKLKLKRAKKKH